MQVIKADTQRSNIHVGSDRLTGLLNAVLAVGVDLDLPALLRRIVESAAALVDARYAALGILDDTRKSLTEFITVGIPQDVVEQIGPLPKGHGILGLLISDPQSVRLVDLNQHEASYGFPPGHPPMHSFLGVPVHGRHGVVGNLYLTDKTNGGSFSAVDEQVVTSFAAAAAVAIDNARLYAQVRQMTLVEDRERIARDMHDTVIERLFATGLSLQAMERLVEGSAIGDRLRIAIGDLDDTIREVRSVIFSLGTAHRLPGGLRAQVIEVAEEASRLIGFVPRVRFEGALDTLVSNEIGNQVLMVLRESLTNVARHAEATEVSVHLSERNGMVDLVVIDNGVGLGDGSPGGRGLRGMSERAESLGGHCQISCPPGGGMRVRWQVPTG